MIRGMGARVWTGSSEVGQVIVGHAEESTTNGYYEVSSEVRKKAVADLAKEMGFENTGG